jgi:hypothetical protein
MDFGCFPIPVNLRQPHDNALFRQTGNGLGVLGFHDVYSFFCQQAKATLKLTLACRQKMERIQQPKPLDALGQRNVSTS